jgi:hypothetical protein
MLSGLGASKEFHWAGRVPWFTENLGTESCGIAAASSADPFVRIDNAAKRL